MSQAQWVRVCWGGVVGLILTTVQCEAVWQQHRPGTRTLSWMMLSGGVSEWVSQCPVQHRLQWRCHITLTSPSSTNKRLEYSEEQQWMIIICEIQARMNHMMKCVIQNLFKSVIIDACEVLSESNHDWWTVSYSELIVLTSLSIIRHHIITWLLQKLFPDYFTRVKSTLLMN